MPTQWRGEPTRSLPGSGGRAQLGEKDAPGSQALGPLAALPARRGVHGLHRGARAVPRPLLPHFSANPGLLGQELVAGRAGAVHRVLRQWRQQLGVTAGHWRRTWPRCRTRRRRRQLSRPSQRRSAGSAGVAPPCSRRTRHPWRPVSSHARISPVAESTTVCSLLYLPLRWSVEPGLSTAHPPTRVIDLPVASTATTTCSPGRGARCPHALPHRRRWSVVGAAAVPVDGRVVRDELLIYFQHPGHRPRQALEAPVGDPVRCAGHEQEGGQSPLDPWTARCSVAGALEHRGSGATQDVAACGGAGVNGVPVVVPRVLGQPGHPVHGWGFAVPAELGGVGRVGHSQCAGQATTV